MSAFRCEMSMECSWNGTLARKMMDRWRLGCWKAANQLTSKTTRCWNLWNVSVVVTSRSVRLWRNLFTLKTRKRRENDATKHKNNVVHCSVCVYTYGAWIASFILVPFDSIVLTLTRVFVVCIFSQFSFSNTCTTLLRAVHRIIVCVFLLFIHDRRPA